MHKEVVANRLAGGVALVPPGLFGSWPRTFPCGGFTVPDEDPDCLPIHGLDPTLLAF